MATWLGVATPENFDLVLRTNTWGVSERSADRIKRVEVRDGLVVHVPPMRCGGIFRVTRRVERDETTNPPYTYRIGIEPVNVPPQPVSIREAFPVLIGANPGGYFRVGFREIPEHEFEAFRDFLESGRADTLEPTTFGSVMEEVPFPSHPGEGGMLVNASETTLGWLGELRKMVSEKQPSLRCSASKYYAAFSSPDTDRNFVYLHLQRNDIRTFTPLTADDDPALQPTPSSGNWADRFPSIYLIQGPGDIKTAAELVLRSHERELATVREGLEGVEGAETNVPGREASGFAVSLERDLEDYLEHQLDELEPGLKLYRDGETSGRQFSTDAGRIDLLATDKSGAFVAIEVKAGRAERDVLGQILTYVNSIREHPAGGQPVRGIIVASDFAPVLLPTTRDLSPKVTLYRYWTEFRFRRLDGGDPPG